MAEYTPLEDKSKENNDIDNNVENELSDNINKNEKEIVLNIKNDSENEEETELTIKTEKDLETKSDKDKSNSEFSEFKKKLHKYRRGIYYTFLIVFYIIFMVYYKKSLIGGDIRFVQVNIGTIASYLIISCISFSITLWIIAFIKVNKIEKIILYVISFASLAVYIIYDHDQFFDHHGMYNIMVFGILFVVLNVIALILYFWAKLAGRKWFLISFSSFILIILIILGISLKHYINIWGNGYLGKKIEDGDNLCKVERPIPWFHLLPKGALNFWLGSSSCSRDEHFDAYFDSTDINKFVVTGCNEKIIYKILPETRNMTYEEKTKLKYPVNKKMEANVHTYTEPVYLKDIEAVYVYCGEQGKLVTRIAERRVEPAKEVQAEDKLNVLMLYIDAVSRRQFFRNLPKTAKKLESIHNSGVSHLNQFFRYGVIGFNTNRNSLGLFTGLQRDGIHSGIPIWEDYRNRGYVAGMTDDLCEDWDRGYNNRTRVSLDHELIAPFCLPEYHELNGISWSIFKGEFSMRRRCITGQYVHNFALNYTRDFINLYDGKNPWFFRASFMEAHESSGEVLSLMDDDLENFFGSLSKETLERTAILIMSDHGLHMGFNFLFTRQGQVEHKLPVFTTLIPERFFNKYPELRKNIDENEQKLISAFDIYATMRDMLDFDISREPKEKLGVGIDISEAKLNDKTKFIRRDSMGEWDEEKSLYSYRPKRLFYEPDHELFKREDTQVVDDLNYGTIIWGKSLLRKVPDGRKCEEILIYPEECVCH